MIAPRIALYLSQLQLPAPDSHKGQNGKLLIIGGSELFHVASKWSLDIASRCVDMLFYSSVPQNNQLVQEAKGAFWNGIVVARTEVENYIQEADAILIGPGMTREEVSLFESQVRTDGWNTGQAQQYWSQLEMSEEDWLDSTEKIVNHLVAKYPNKKWVIDAGALQMIDAALVTDSCIITPHSSELHRFLSHSANLKKSDLATKNEYSEQDLIAISAACNNCCIVLKGETDMVVKNTQSVSVSGGSPGMTKGGTGDVLSGLIAGLYATNSQLSSAVIGSYINKKTGEQMEHAVGPFFNASDLAATIPEVLWLEYQLVTKQPTN